MIYKAPKSQKESGRMCRWDTFAVLWKRDFDRLK